MSTITTKDRTLIYYKDWGSGQPIVFSHGWPLNSDSWESRPTAIAVWRMTAAVTAVPVNPGTATTWTPMPMTSQA